ncbi:MAG: pantothenate synthetase [Bacteriovoracaceae bacterium]|nr:pantothenate synthetase [Bacteriovoracaceae bacterium]
MKILRTRKAMIAWRKQLSPKISVGFVPTMGALHDGHLSLVRAAFKQNDKVVVSIFVNPTQFGPHEDFKKYPRPEVKDIGLLRAENVSAVFIPSVEEIYTSKESTMVVPRKSLTSQLEGIFRPGHFEGVATVVLKFFEIVRPDRAYFGEKDFQQLRVIETLVEDLFLPIEIKRCRTLREKSGLALSSRNAYLSSQDRLRAAQIFRTLTTARSVGEAKAKLKRSGFKIQYLEAWEENLRFPSRAKKSRWLIATTFQGVRLIDNLLRD